MSLRPEWLMKWFCRRIHAIADWLSTWATIHDGGYCLDRHGFRGQVPDGAEAILDKNGKIVGIMRTVR